MRESAAGAGVVLLFRWREVPPTPCDGVRKDAETSSESHQPYSVKTHKTGEVTPLSSNDVTETSIDWIVVMEQE